MGSYLGLRFRHELRWPATLLAVLALGAAPARAWTPATQQVIADEAARLAPPDLARQIERHHAEYRKGVQAPFQSRELRRHVKYPDGRGELDQVILVEAAAAVEAIRNHEPFETVVFRLGVVSHYVADANNPLNASDADPREGDFYADYLRYVQSIEPRLPLIFYGLAPNLDHLPNLRPLIDDALDRSRRFYASIGREYRRIGFASGVTGFDDRSTAFGVAAVSFSQAVSDVVQALRHIWVRAGGIDERSGLPERGQRVLLLPRHEPDAGDRRGPRAGR